MIDLDKPYVLDNQMTIDEWLEEQKKEQEQEHLQNNEK